MQYFSNEMDPNTQIINNQQLLQAIKTTMDNDFSKFSDHDKGVISQFAFRLIYNMQV